MSASCHRCCGCVEHQHGHPEPHVVPVRDVVRGGGSDMGGRESAGAVWATCMRCVHLMRCVGESSDGGAVTGKRWGGVGGCVHSWQQEAAHQGRTFADAVLPCSQTSVASALPECCCYAIRTQSGRCPSCTVPRYCAAAVDAVLNLVCVPLTLMLFLGPASTTATLPSSGSSVQVGAVQPERKKERVTP